MNTLKKEREQNSLGDKYPWLDQNNERRHMMDKEILDKYIDLDQSCLSKEEKKEVMDMLYRYREAFSLRDEIGTCPNIHIKIDVKEEDKPFIIKK